MVLIATEPGPVLRTSFRQLAPLPQVPESEYEWSEHEYAAIPLQKQHTCLAVMEPDYETPVEHTVLPTAVPNDQQEQNLAVRSPSIEYSDTDVSHN